MLTAGWDKTMLIEVESTSEHICFFVYHVPAGANAANAQRFTLHLRILGSFLTSNERPR